MPSRYLVPLLIVGAILGLAADPPTGESVSDSGRNIGAGPYTNPHGAPSDSSQDGAPVNILPRARPGSEETTSLPKATISTDVNVVLVPVTVTDPLNRFVTGLDQEAFEVYEDRIK